MSGRPDIGAMRHRFTLEVPVETPDLAGGVARGWSAAGPLWGSLEPRRQAPGTVADAPATVSSFGVTTRWRGDLAAGQRLRLGARLFLIRAVADPDERRAHLVLTVEETGA